jgi:hypothetical protein
MGNGKLQGVLFSAKRFIHDGINRTKIPKKTAAAEKSK